MRLEDVAAALGIDETAREALAPGWEESQAEMPSDPLPFLDPETVEEACRAALVSEEVAAAARAFAPRIQQDKALCALAWHYRWCLYPTARHDWGRVWRWPDLEGVLGNDRGLFFLIVLLSNLPAVQELHRRHRVPDDVVRETLLDLQLWLDHERQRHPEMPCSLGPGNLAWLSNHFRGQLFRLGRLQFQFAECGYPIRVYRHRESGLVVAVSQAGVRYEANGGRDGAAEAEAPGAWVAELTETEGEVIAHPIRPTGHALREQVRLDKREWEQALGPGDPVLNLHIPAGSPLTHESCGESFRRAVAFFPRHFPERPYRAFLCGSWLLDAQIEDLLGPDSNIVRFQRELYLFPIPLHSRYLLSRVFGEETQEPEQVAAAPQRTAFQRALAAHLEAGRPLRPAGGGCFLLPEDLRWGEQVYRRQELPWEMPAQASKLPVAPRDREGAEVR